MSLARRRVRYWPLVLIPALLLAALGGLPLGSGARAGGLNPYTTTLAYPPPPLLASAAALLDADTGDWLYLAHADQPRAMASTTKIMTAVLAIEHGHLGDLVRVSRAAASIGQTTMGLVAGERVRMLDLLYGLMLPSGNDAAITIAEHVAGSQRRFVALMNARAAALHLTHTHYVNPFGFVDTPDGDDPAHYTSARDLVLLASYAMRNPLFRRVVGTRHYVVPATTHNQEHDLQNINQALYWYPGADGVKPGWTSGAGICLVVDVRRHGRHLIAALLNTPDLHTDVRDLLNYGFGDFTWFPSRWADDTTNRVLRGGGPGVPGLYFPYTGHAITGAMATYFVGHGGLASLGFPRTEQIPVDGQIQQFFTNRVLVYDAQARLVTPLRLGLEAVPSRALLARVPPVPNTPWRTYYPQTGHTVTYRFREHYLAGGGPATFGYPVTEKISQGGTLVQYFENAEFTWHGDPAGAGYVAEAPLGERRLYEFGLLPGIVPARLPLVPARLTTTRPSPTAAPAPPSPPATLTTTPWPPTITPLPTSTAGPFVPGTVVVTPPVVVTAQPWPTAPPITPASSPSVAGPASTDTPSPSASATATEPPLASDTPVPAT